VPSSQTANQVDFTKTLGREIESESEMTVDEPRPSRSRRPTQRFSESMFSNSSLYSTSVVPGPLNSSESKTKPD
jgi:hypothetical protein